MQRIRFILISACLLAALSLLAQEAAPPPAPPTAGPAREIKISAKKYEYTPGEIRVKQGERVRLLITATDRKHGFEIKELGIKTVLEKGKETVVEFTADKPGVFQIKCSSWCGFGHGGMRATLVVEPAEEASPSNN